MIKIINSGDFDLMYRQLIREQSISADEISDIILQFKKNPDDARLLNHPLKRDMKGKWAFSITDDIRVVYEWLGKTTVRFLAIGGHKKVYKRSQ